MAKHAPLIPISNPGWSRAFWLVTRVILRDSHRQQETSYQAWRLCTADTQGVLSRMKTTSRYSMLIFQGIWTHYNTLIQTQWWAQEASVEEACSPAGTEPSQIWSASRDIQTLERPFSCFLTRNFPLKSLCLRAEQKSSVDVQRKRNAVSHT